MEMKGLLLVLVTLTVGAFSQQVQNDKPSIYSLHIRSDIAYRFATTVVVSQLANPANESREAVFRLQLPDTAFISNFSMLIDGKEYGGVVKEKEKAKKEYEAAKKKGQSAGHVAAKPRNTNKFQVAVNVAAMKKVQFTLSYQELLRRRLSAYENIIYIDPGQLVRDFKVDIFINESRPIKNLFIAPLKKDNEILLDNSKQNDLAVQQMQSDRTAAHIMYHPSYEQQRAKNAAGLQGELILRYDVEREIGAGEIQVVDGYFVHYFAPKGLPMGNKAIIFILDVSGSMYGTKLVQVKDSMRTILNDLGDGDVVNIITFESGTKFWKPTMQKVDAQLKQDALQFASKMKADGGTNINQAVLDGIDFLDKAKYELEQSGVLASVMVLLTDGDPTTGETNKENIQDNIRRKNEGRFALYSLGFGANLDFKFLQKLSLQNKGIARKIYEDSDAVIQLKNFYSEISDPLLANVAFNYVDNNSHGTLLTTTRFPSYFSGGEIVVAGKVVPNAMNTNSIRAAISARSADGPVNYQRDVALVSGNSPGQSAGVRKFTERLWAYLTIKELLDKMLATSNKTEEAIIKAKALELSLKYSFVTPLTSMVVIKPDEPDTDASNIDEANVDRPGGRQSAKRQPSKSPARRPAVSNNRGSSFADNDPHFMISVSGSERPVCFDVNGVESEVYQLVSDQHLGLSVNARILDSGRKSKKGKPLTYFGKIAIVTNDLTLLATPHSFKVDTTAYNWKRGQELIRNNIRMIWPDKGQVEIFIRKGVTVTIARHVQKGQRTDKSHYLGFYINDGSGFSPLVHGLMGQFQHRRVSIEDSQNDNSTGQLKFISSKVPDRDTVLVYHGSRRNLLNKLHVQCWHVRNQGRGFLDGAVTDYRVPKMTSRQLSKTFIKRFVTSSTKSAKQRKHFKKRGMHVGQ